MTTVTESEIYVSCENYCGLRISHTGESGKNQHAADCGAPLAELARLDSELAVKRIRATAAAEADTELDDDVPAAQFVCVCNEAFGTWEQLGDHQTATGHQGCATDESDALDDDALDEREDTVDGTAAKIKHGGSKGPKVGEKIDYSHLWRDPMIDSEMVYALQAKINDGTLTLGGIAAGKACIGTMSVDPGDGSAVEVGCPNKCFARTVRKNECDLEHVHSETLEQVCLLHSITSWGAGRPLMGAGPLFGADA